MVRGPAGPRRTRHPRQAGEKYCFVLAKSIKKNLRDVSQSGQARDGMADRAATLSLFRLEPLIDAVEVLAAAINLVSRGMRSSTRANRRILDRSRLLRCTRPPESIKVIKASNVYEDMRAHPAVALSVDGTPDDRGDRLAALFDAHEDRLYRLARRLASSADEADDLVQETFLRAAKSLRSVPAGSAKEEAWLVRVLVNIRRDEWRRAAVRRRSVAFLDGGGITDDSNLEAALIAKRAVWRALDALHPRRRAIVIMSELEGMSAPAVGALLGVSAMTVRWHLSMGRRDLKRILEPQMGDAI
jgi:RNA polymerase sigma-70 factor (ECF subfamily)